MRLFRKSERLWQHTVPEELSAGPRVPQARRVRDFEVNSARDGCFDQRYLFARGGELLVRVLLCATRRRAQTGTFR